MRILYTRYCSLTGEPLSLKEISCMLTVKILISNCDQQQTRITSIDRHVHEKEGLTKQNLTVKLP